ncbi:MAG: DUF2809 domain-containing protein [Acidobacteriaceae bacterium]|jgi:hypothetical protein
MKPRSLKSSLALFLVTVMAGLAVRMAPLGLPAVVVKYGGSMMWAVMIYWIVSTALARWRLPVVVTIAGAIATAVEFFKLYHSPGMDAFRLTLPGIILLGRIFSVRDIVAYWVAISVAACVDAGIRRLEG